MTRTIKRTAATALAAVGLAVIAGCGSGLDAQTYDSKAMGNSSDASDGSLAVRHVYVVNPDTEEGYAVGDDAELVLSATTRAGEDDRLVSATSDDAASVTVPDGLVVPNDGILLDQKLELVDLNRALRGSDFVDLSLTFSSGAVIDMRVPVAVNTEEPATNPDFEVPETDSVGDPLVHSEE